MKGPLRWALFAWFLALNQPIDAQEPSKFEKIRDTSPDGKFAVRISCSSEPEDPNNIDSSLITGVELISLSSKKTVMDLQNYDGSAARVIWSPDSNWLAFSSSSGPRVSDTYVYRRSGDDFVFQRMGELMTEGRRVDIVTLAEQLQRNKELSAIGGVAWLASLTEGLPRRLSIEDYVRIVKDKSLLRQTIVESNRVGVLAVDQSGSAEEVLAEAESSFRRIAGKTITAGLTSVAEYIRDQYPCIDKIFEQSARLTGIPSGFCGLDNLTAGFQPKELTILGARPSTGSG